MKRYIEHIQSQPPHYRRQHAARVAGVVTAIVFMGWISSLGVRFATHTKVTDSPVSGAGDASSATQFANVISGISTQNTTNTLEVLDTTTSTSRPAGAGQ